MRLSLKTILAYTDNLYDTEYHPAIEKRIGEESVAGYLIDRMSAVMRNPDIPVPGRQSEKEELSANLVAAYLDNLLSDTEQSQFETFCLRSDIYLAEVACTHQILTTILGQPAKLNRDCRLRLYAIPRHRKELAADAPLSQEHGEQEMHGIIEPQITDPAPVPRTKRRITVTVRENSDMPPQEPHDMSAEQSASPLLQPDHPVVTVRSVGDRISRLGQAFAHQKRHRQIMMISSLVLLFLCVSIYSIARLNPRHLKSEVAQQRPPATVTGILALDDDHGNARHFDDHGGEWGHRNMASHFPGSIPGVSAGIGIETQGNANFSSCEPPDSVMQYFPGDTDRPSEILNQTLIASSVSPSFPQPNLPQPPITSLTTLPMTAVASPPMPRSWSPQPSDPVPPQSMGQQNPLQSPYSSATANMPTAQTSARPMSEATRSNNFPGVPNQANMQFVGHYGTQPPVQSPQRQSESTIQLIDRDNVPSVNQFSNPPLPAVQPPTWETNNQTNSSSQTMSSGTNNQATFSYYMQTPGATTHLADGTFLSDQTVEQASYTSNPRQPNMPPPLVEPTWNDPRNDSFEPVNDAPRFQANHITSQPLRLPDTTVASHAGSPNLLPTQRRLVPNVSNADPGCPTLLLGTEDLVLVRETPATEWSWLPISKQLVSDIVLVPAPFRAAISFPNGIVVETEGDTRVQILPDDEAGHPALAFDCGHLTISATGNQLSHSNVSQSLRIVTPVGGGVLRLTDTTSFVTIDSENKTTVKLLKVTRPYESVTANPVLYRSHLDANVVYCPNLMTFPANGKTIYWQKDGHTVEWELGTASIFPIDNEKSTPPILLYNTDGLIVASAVAWPSLVSHDGRIPITKLDLKNQFVTMPHTFYPTPSKIWLLR